MKILSVRHSQFKLICVCCLSWSCLKHWIHSEYIFQYLLWVPWLISVLFFLILFLNFLDSCWSGIQTWSRRDWVNLNWDYLSLKIYVHILTFQYTAFCVFTLKQITYNPQSPSWSTASSIQRHPDETHSACSRLVEAKNNSCATREEEFHKELVCEEEFPKLKVVPLMSKVCLRFVY